MSASKACAISGGDCYWRVATDRLVQTRRVWRAKGEREDMVCTAGRTFRERVCDLFKPARDEPARDEALPIIAMKRPFEFLKLTPSALEPHHLVRCCDVYRRRKV